MRFKALDIFRGMTIAFMIIVNTPGDWGNTFGLLLHAKWHGFTPTDLVFPSFLFAVGNAMAFVSLKWQHMTGREVYLKALKRVVLIFLIGFLLSWFPFLQSSDGGLSLSPFSETRFMGVLQRIALCYAVALPFVYHLTPQKLVYVSVAMLLAYWGLLVGFGDLTLEGNAVLKLDLWIFGANHLYGGEGIPFDPEGLLSTLPATVNVFLGYLVGIYLRDNKGGYEPLAKILLIGVSLMFVAYLWDVSFPINKKLWTSSFVLLTGGLNCVILGVIIFLMELAPRKLEFRVFNTFGKNPLFIYMLSSVLTTMLFTISVSGQNAYSWFYQNLFQPIGFGTPLGSLLFALSFTTVCWLVARWMEKRNIYVKI